MATAIEDLNVDDLLEGKFMNVSRKNPRSERHSTAKISGVKTNGALDSDKSARKLGKDRKSEGASFKDDLKALQERDPEFYNYLRQTDSGLLDFALDDTDEEEPEPSPSQQDVSDEKDDQRVLESENEVTTEQLQDQEVLTPEVLTSWCTEATNHASLHAMRKLVKAFRIACHYGDSEMDMHETLKATSSAVFNKLLIFMLKEAEGIFRRLLDLEHNADIASGLFRKTKRWQKMEPLLKSYLGNSLHLLGHATSPGMLMFILRKLRVSIPFMASFQRLQRKYMRQAISIFSSNEAATRVQALLFIRQMATTLPAPAMDQAVKGVYRAFVRNAKFMTPSSMPHVAFLGSCVVEMFGLDMAVAYEHAFTYIRQLAALLRSALSHKTKDALREVYCWQNVNALELWAKVLAAHNDKEELRPLVYPLCQVLIGVVRLIPTPRYFPLHLRLIRALVDLGASTRTLLPTTPLLLDMLHWSALSKPIRAGEGQPPQSVLLLRASKATLMTTSFQTDIVEQIMELLASHLAPWACSVAYPELAHLPLQGLRCFAKSTNVERFRSAAKGLAAALEETTVAVSARRSAASFAPKDTGAAQNFISEADGAQELPLHLYANLLRMKARQRQALRGTGLVRTEENADAARTIHGVEEEDDDAESEDIELPEAKTSTRRKRLKPETPATDLPQQMMEFGDEDELDEYELSD